MTLSIRRAHASEAEELGALGFRAWDESIYAELDGGRGDRAGIRKEFMDFCRDSYAVIRVAEDDGHVLGWGGREEADYISDLWVASGSRGKGVGRLLLNALEADIRADGKSTSFLETHAGNTPATGFYLKQGYSIIWRGERFSSALGYAIDKLRFSKDLETKTISA